MVLSFHPIAMIAEIADILVKRAVVFEDNADRCIACSAIVALLSQSRCLVLCPCPVQSKSCHAITKIKLFSHSFLQANRQCQRSLCCKSCKSSLQVRHQNFVRSILIEPRLRQITISKNPGSFEYFKRSINCWRGCCFFAFDSRFFFFFSRSSLARQLPAQDPIEHVLPCVWVHWTHTKWCQVILTCFFFIFLQLLQFQIALSWLSLARFTVSTLIIWPQIEGHLTNNCVEVVSRFPACESLDRVIVSSVCARNVMICKQSSCLTGNNDV